MVEFTVTSYCSASAFQLKETAFHCGITLDCHVPGGKSDSFCARPVCWWDANPVFSLSGCLQGMAEKWYSCGERLLSRFDSFFLSMRDLFTLISGVRVDWSCRVGFTVRGLFRRAVRKFSDIRRHLKNVVSRRFCGLSAAAPMRL